MRTEDWQLKIADVFIERIAMRFQWGINDCCLFAADCFYAATGTDPAGEFRGEYTDAISAARVLSRLGGLEVIAAKNCGPEILPSQSSFGDIGLVDNAGRPCLSVFGGEYFHAPGDDGLKIFPLDNCLRAWRLPK